MIALNVGAADNRGDPSTLIFFALAASAAALILALSSDLTFFLDEWAVILGRQDWSADALLEPHNEHPYLGPIVIYKLLLGAFGMESTLPFQIANVALLVLVAGLVFVLVRRRLGGVPALVAAALLLTLGASWENLLWPAGISFLGALSAGLAVMVLLDRERPPLALICVALVVGLCFSSLGLIFVIGFVVETALRRGGEPWSRRLAAMWPAGVAVALYGIWYLAYGTDAESAASLDNLLATPIYIWDAASIVLAALFGLLEVDSVNQGAVSGIDWGKPLLVVALLGAGLTLARGRRVPSARLWAMAAIALTFWGLAGLNAIPGREAGASRYLLIGAVLVVLIATELLRGVRLSRPAAMIAAVVAAFAVVSNIGALRDGQRFLEAQSNTARAELAALELAREGVDPAFGLTPEVAGTPYLAPIAAGPYFAAIDRWGSPVDSPADLEVASEADRARADTMLAAALGAALRPVATGAGCEPATAPSQSFELPPEGALVEPLGGSVAVRVGRFAEADPVELGAAPGPMLLTIGGDESSTPWRVSVEGRARICPAPSA